MTRAASGPIRARSARAWLSGLAVVSMLCVARQASAATRPATAAASHSTVAHAQSVVPFIDEDYAKALAVARAKKLPLFIEAWAPW